MSTYCRGIRVKLRDNLVELLLWVLSIRGELGGNVAKNCDLFIRLHGDTDQRAIGAEELIDLF